MEKDSTEAFSSDCSNVWADLSRNAYEEISLVDACIAGGAQEDCRGAIDRLSQQGVNLDALKRGLGLPLNWEQVAGILSRMETDYSPETRGALADVLNACAQPPGMPIDFERLSGKRTAELRSCADLIRACSRLEDVLSTGAAAGPPGRDAVRRLLNGALESDVSAGRLADLSQAVRRMGELGFGGSTATRRANTQLVLEAAEAAIRNRHMHVSLSNLVRLPASELPHACQLLALAARSYTEPVEVSGPLRFRHNASVAAMQACAAGPIRGESWIFVPSAFGSHAESERIDGLLINTRSGRVVSINWNLPGDPLSGGSQQSPGARDQATRLTLEPGRDVVVASGPGRSKDPIAAMRQFLEQQLDPTLDRPGARTMRLSDVGTGRFPSMALPAANESIPRLMRELREAGPPAASVLISASPEELGRQHLASNIREAVRAELGRRLVAAIPDGQPLTSMTDTTRAALPLVLRDAPGNLLQELRLYPDGTLVAVIGTAPGATNENAPNRYVRVGSLSELMVPSTLPRAQTDAIAEILRDATERPLNVKPDSPLSKVLEALMPVITRLAHEATIPLVRDEVRRQLEWRTLADPVRERFMRDMPQQIMNLLERVPTLSLSEAAEHVLEIDIVADRRHLSFADAMNHYVEWLSRRSVLARTGQQLSFGEFMRIGELSERMRGTPEFERLRAINPDVRDLLYHMLRMSILDPHANETVCFERARRAAVYSWKHGVSAAHGRIATMLDEYDAWPKGGDRQAYLELAVRASDFSGNRESFDDVLAAVNQLKKVALPSARTMRELRDRLDSLGPEADLRQLLSTIVEFASRNEKQFQPLLESGYSLERIRELLRGKGNLNPEQVRAELFMRASVPLDARTLFDTVLTRLLRARTAAVEAQGHEFVFDCLRAQLTDAIGGGATSGGPRRNIVRMQSEQSVLGPGETSLPAAPERNLSEKVQTALVAWSKAQGNRGDAESRAARDAAEKDMNPEQKAKYTAWLKLLVAIDRHGQGLPAAGNFNAEQMRLVAAMSNQAQVPKDGLPEERMRSLIKAINSRDALQGLAIAYMIEGQQWMPGEYLVERGGQTCWLVLKTPLAAASVEQVLELLEARPGGVSPKVVTISDQGRLSATADLSTLEVVIRGGTTADAIRLTLLHEFGHVMAVRLTEAERDTLREVKSACLNDPRARKLLEELKIKGKNLTAQEIDAVIRQGSYFDRLSCGESPTPVEFLTYLLASEEVYADLHAVWANARLQNKNLTFAEAVELARQQDMLGEQPARYRLLMLFERLYDAVVPTFQRQYDQSAQRSSSLPVPAEKSPGELPGRESAVPGAVRQQAELPVPVIEDPRALAARAEAERQSGVERAARAAHRERDQGALKILLDEEIKRLEQDLKAKAAEPSSDRREIEEHLAELQRMRQTLATGGAPAETLVAALRELLAPGEKPSGQKAPSAVRPPAGGSGAKLVQIGNAFVAVGSIFSALHDLAARRVQSGRELELPTRVHNQPIRVHGR